MNNFLILVMSILGRKHVLGYTEALTFKSTAAPAGLPLVPSEVISHTHSETIYTRSIVFTSHLEFILGIGIGIGI